MSNKEITNEDIMQEIKNLRRDIDNIRQMIYEVNSDFYDTMQIANFNNRYPFEIRPLTNRELLLYSMQKFPIIDPETRREKLMSRDELIRNGYPMNYLRYGFEIKQDDYEEDEL